jgi:hypothetical protein
MSTKKSKTLATFLALVAGGLGAHRFYLKGLSDRAGLLHLASLPLSGLLARSFPSWPGLFAYAPLVLSMLIGVLAALVLGLTPDEKWDATHNPDAGTPSKSGWPLVILLVLSVGLGSIGLIWVIARSFDLMLTGGAYG